MMSGEMDKKEAFSVYGAFRQRAVDEYSFINHRLSWMIWSEALILTAWGVMVSPERISHANAVGVYIVLLVLSVCGLLVAYWTHRSVEAAKDEVEFIKTEYATHYPELHSDKSIPKLTGTPRNHKDGHMVPTWLPWGMVVIQLLLIAYALTLLGDKLFSQSPLTKGQ